MRRILVLGASASERQHLQLLLAQRGYDVVSAADANAANRELADGNYDCAVVDAAAVAAIAGANQALTIIGVGGGIDAGAYDALTTPVTDAALEPVLRRADERVSLLRRLRGRAISRNAAGVTANDVGMIGGGAGMARVFSEMRKVAPYKTSVLITGESGTGKELVARGLHRLSTRADMPFVAINCGAIPPTLLESELFGHCKGAFTDAVRDKKGMFFEANGGTLFLDELGELPLELQVKLLRVLQEEEVRPVGENISRRVDVRVVAATVRDLEREIQRGRFREDLYYRLNVVPIRLPPLRERPQDIPSLVDYFVRAYSRKHGGAGLQVRAVSDDAMTLLKGYSWPGNIRELENSIERAMVLCEGEIIEASLLEDKLQTPVAVAAPVGDAEELSIKKMSRALERDLIRRALARTEGNRTAAAKLLEISHRALLYKIKDYGL